MTFRAKPLKLQDADAWNEFYQEYLDPLYGFVYRLVCHKRTVADDLFQEVWLHVIQNIDTYDSEKGELSAWLFGIARRRVALYWRRTLAGKSVDDDNLLRADRADAALLPIEAMEQIERAEVVNSALLVMPENQRRILRQKYIDGMSVAEIAKRSSTTQKAAESLLFRARAKLRSLLGPTFVDALPSHLLNESRRPK